MYEIETIILHYSVFSRTIYALNLARGSERALEFVIPRGINEI